MIVEKGELSRNLINHSKKRTCATQFFPDIIFPLPLENWLYRSYSQVENILLYYIVLYLFYIVHSRLSPIVGFLPYDLDSDFTTIFMESQWRLIFKSMFCTKQRCLTSMQMYTSLSTNYLM